MRCSTSIWSLTCTSSETTRGSHPMTPSARGSLSHHRPNRPGSFCQGLCTCSASKRDRGRDSPLVLENYHLRVVQSRTSQHHRSGPPKGLNRHHRPNLPLPKGDDSPKCAVGSLHLFSPQLWTSLRFLSSQSSGCQQSGPHPHPNQSPGPSGICMMTDSPRSRGCSQSCPAHSS